MKNTEISLHIPPLMWQQLRRSMIDARSHHEETIGFLFCSRDKVSTDRLRYLPKTWVVPAPDCYELQSISGLVIKQDFHQYLIDSFLHVGEASLKENRQLDVVHIHTHAGTDFPEFSAVDDRAESEYAQFLNTQFKTKPRLISGVFDESLQHGQFRIWNRKGTEFKPVTFYNSLLELPSIVRASQPHSSFPSRSLLALSEVEMSEVEMRGFSADEFDPNLENNSIVSPLPSPDPMFDRQTIFGATAQQQLGQLTVALIGCGGIGSIFAETLGRLGVKNWILVDPDRLETVNLNRMPAATAEMVADGWHKVDYLKHLINQIYPTDANVRTIPDLIANVTADIATADLIVVATDNHSSRQIAQEIALKYMRPLVCLGTHIDVKSDGTPRMYARVTVPPLGGGWCLMCGNIINLQRAALESAPTAIDLMATKAGYLDGVNDPAVFWLNGIAASTGVGVIHGMVSGFVDVAAGIDWIYEFPGHQWHKTNPEHLHTPDCYFCSH